MRCHGVLWYFLTEPVYHTRINDVTVDDLATQGAINNHGNGLVLPQHSGLPLPQGVGVYRKYIQNIICLWNSNSTAAQDVCCYFEQAVEQAVELLVMRDALTPMWRHSNLIEDTVKCGLKPGVNAILIKSYCLDTFKLKHIYGHWVNVMHLGKVGTFMYKGVYSISMEIPLVPGMHAVVMLLRMSKQQGPL